MDDAEMTLSDSTFQMLAVATVNARQPTEYSLEEGTAGWSAAADRSVRQHSAISLMGHQYQ